MNDEQKRILRMLAEGPVLVDECDELLRASWGWLCSFSGSRC